MCSGEKFASRFEVVSRKLTDLSLKLVGRLSPKMRLMSQVATGYETYLHDSGLSPPN